jgi:hypothetical protein
MAAAASVLVDMHYSNAVLPEKFTTAIPILQRKHYLSNKSQSVPKNIPVCLQRKSFCRFYDSPW